MAFIAPSQCSFSKLQLNIIILHIIIKLRNGFYCIVFLFASTQKVRLRFSKFCLRLEILTGLFLSVVVSLLPYIFKSVVSLAKSSLSGSFSMESETHFCRKPVKV